MKFQLPKGILRETLKMALDSVRGHKFRSFLTVLGIVIGVMTAICIASLLTGLRQNIIAMIERSEYKRQQAAPGLKITEKAFGSGRRFPIAQRFEG